MGTILRSMEEICKEQATCLDVDLASSVATLATKELTGEASNEACELLVALGRSHCSTAMAAVLTRSGKASF